jgi:hypothetical protein
LRNSYRGEDRDDRHDHQQLDESKAFYWVELFWCLQNGFAVLLGVLGLPD